MSLKPGSPIYDAVEDKYVWNSAALLDSMAQEIENEMKKVYKSLKGEDMPDNGEEDRLLLFSAIARGVLYYLDRHAGDLIDAVTIAHTTGTHTDTVHSMTGLDLDVTDEYLPG